MRGVALVALALAAGCAAAPQDIRSIITPEAIAASSEPLLFFELTETGQQAIMSLTGRNGNVVTWSTADGKSISLQDGVLVATRGFGFDLMSADVSGTIGALNGVSREYWRFATYLDGQNASLVRSFLCVMTGPEDETINSFGRIVAVERWTEECASLSGNVSSVFDAVNGEVWRAQQLISAPTGGVLTERLTGS